MSMHNYYNSFFYKLILRVIYLIFVALLIITFGKPIYGTTDDYILSSFIDGSYTGQAETISIFVEPLISLIIYTIQIQLPEVIFYSVFLLIILIISLAVFGTILSKLNYPNFFLEIIWVILSSGLIIWFALNPTYTSSSMLSSAINITSLMILTSNKICVRYPKTIIVATSILFTLSYLIRPESGAAVIIIFLLFIIIKITNEILSKSINYYNYFFSLLTFIIIILLNFSLTQYQKNSEWDIYNSWNSMRHQIQQRLPEDKLLDLRSEIGWTIPEYHLFMNLSFGDFKEFNSEWLKPAFIKTQQFRGIDAIYNLNENFNVQRISETYKNYRNYFIFNSIFLLIIVSFFKFNTLNNFHLAISVLLVNLVICYMSIFLHAPERAVIPLMIFPLLLIIYSLSIENTSHRKELSKGYIFSAIFVLIIFLGIYFKFKNSENATKISHAKIINNWLIAFNKSALYFGPVGIETYHLKSPYMKQKINEFPKIFITGNWETFSPHWFKRMEFLGLNKNFFYDNLFDENIYWISYPQPDNAYLVELYLKEKNYPNFYRRNLVQHETGLAIYKFTLEK